MLRDSGIMKRLARVIAHPSEPNHIIQRWRLNAMTSPILPKESQLTQTEVWKSAEGFRGYDVSSLGRVRSYWKRGHQGFPLLTPQRILKPIFDPKGYPSYILRTVFGKPRQIKAHRLVAKTFISNPNDLPQVNHKNGIKTDASVENLEWCTNGENQLHAYRLGLNKPRRKSIKEHPRKLYYEPLEPCLNGTLVCKKDVDATIVEVWLPIPEFIGYDVSSQGRVRSWWFPRSIGRVAVLDTFPRLLKPQINQKGYCQIGLYKNHKIKVYPIHRLVAKLFVANPLKTNIVHHKNGVRSDARADNLEWTTYAGNMKHAANAGMFKGKFGSNKNVAKLNEVQVIEIRRLAAEGRTYREIATFFGVHPSLIGLIRRRKIWTHV